MILLHTIPLQVEQYSQQITVLEDDLASARQTAASSETKFILLEEEYRQLKTSQETSEEKIQTAIELEKLKRELDELTAKHAEVSEINCVLLLWPFKNGDRRRS